MTSAFSLLCGWLYSFTGSMIKTSRFSLKALNDNLKAKLLRASDDMYDFRKLEWYKFQCVAKKEKRKEKKKETKTKTNTNK